MENVSFSVWRLHYIYIGTHTCIKYTSRAFSAGVVKIYKVQEYTPHTFDRTYMAHMLMQLYIFGDVAVAYTHMYHIPYRIRGKIVFCWKLRCIRIPVSVMWAHADFVKPNEKRAHTHTAELYRFDEGYMVFIFYLFVASSPIYMRISLHRLNNLYAVVISSSSSSSYIYL